MLGKFLAMSLVGKEVDIFWVNDESWYPGTVEKFDEDLNKFFVKYEDGDSEWIDGSLRENIRLRGGGGWEEEGEGEEVQSIQNVSISKIKQIHHDLLLHLSSSTTPQDAFCFVKGDIVEASNLPEPLDEGSFVRVLFSEGSSSTSSSSLFTCKTTVFQTPSTSLSTPNPCWDCPFEFHVLDDLDGGDNGCEEGFLPEGEVHFVIYSNSTSTYQTTLPLQTILNQVHSEGKGSFHQQRHVCQASLFNISAPLSSTNNINIKSIKQQQQLNQDSPPTLHLSISIFYPSRQSEDTHEPQSVSETKVSARMSRNRRSSSSKKKKRKQRKRGMKTGAERMRKHRQQAREFKQDRLKKQNNELKKRLDGIRGTKGGGGGRVENRSEKKKRLAKQQRSYASKVERREKREREGEEKVWEKRTALMKEITEMRDVVKRMKTSLVVGERRIDQLVKQEEKLRVEVGRKRMLSERKKKADDNSSLHPRRTTPRQPMKRRGYDSDDDDSSDEEEEEVDMEGLLVKSEVDALTRSLQNKQATNSQTENQIMEVETAIEEFNEKWGLFMGSFSPSSLPSSTDRIIEDQTNFLISQWSLKQEARELEEDIQHLQNVKDNLKSDQEELLDMKREFLEIDDD